MPLVVPTLRLFMVFMNVYDTYKILKLPNGRKGGPPTIRALTQRKRALKGCLAVWIVWCCFALYERTFDRLISFIIPFYGEIKSVTLLFLLLTRAKGAEPLYLHILRPLVKPYVNTVDPLLDVGRDIGDFLFALSQVPLNYVVSLCAALRWHIEGKESATDLSKTSASGLSTTPSSSNASIPTVAKAYTVVSNSPVVDRRPGVARGVSDDMVRHKSHKPSVEIHKSMSLRERHSKSASTTTFLPYPSDVHVVPASNNHRKYRRSLPTYEENIAPSEKYNTSTNPLMASPPVVVVSDATEVQHEEWRLYPAFPSAYPSTPLPACHFLPGIQSSGQAEPVGLLSARVSSTSPILEDAILEDAKQDSHVPLHQVIRPTNPSSSSGSSDENNSLSGVRPNEDGVQSFNRNGDVGSQDENEDPYMDAEDDDFDVTLRTPYSSFPSSVESTVTSSAASLPSALTTNDNASSLRTRTSSESSSSFHTSDSSSYTRRKRSYPTVTMKSRTVTVSSYRKNVISGKAALVTSYKNDLDSDPSDNIHRDTDSGDSGAGVKRRKVIIKPKWKAADHHPTAEVTTNVRKTSLATRNLSASARGKFMATPQKTRGRGASRAAPRIVGAARQDTLRAQTRRSSSKVSSQDSTTYSHSGTVRNTT